MSQFQSDKNIVSPDAQALQEMSESPETRWLAVLSKIEDFESYFASNRIPRLRPFLCRMKGHGNDLDVSALESGVYLLFDDRDQLLYVGVTRNRVKDRVADHDQRFESTYLDVIPIANHVRWLACALERFLIDQLRPPLNEI